MGGGAWRVRRGLSRHRLPARQRPATDPRHVRAAHRCRQAVAADALVATTDTVAAEAYQAIAERGLRIPEDIAVVGTNDSSIAQLLVPPLATIEIPAGYIGRTAVELLLERCRGGQVTKTVIVHTSFVARPSLSAAPMSMTKKDKRRTSRA